MGVAIAVVLADRDQGDQRVDGGDECRVGGARPVVRHLQHAGAEPRWHAEQFQLGGLFRIAGEKDAAVALVDPQDERHLVRLRVGARERSPAGRREDVHGQFTDPGGLSGHRLGDGDTAGIGGSTQGGLVRRVALHGTQPQGTHGDAGQHRRQAHRVIGVWVRLDDEVEGPDAVPVQPAGHLVLVGAAVHEDAGARPLDEDRVALADIDGGDGEPGGDGPRDGHQQRRTQDRRHGARTRPTRATPDHAPQGRPTGQQEQPRGRHGHHREVRQPGRGEHDS